MEGLAVYGMSCAINFVLPGAYYLAARFPGDFESTVLHAINGGGQNMSRACLAGALVGAQAGLSGIPRVIDGLKRQPAKSSRREGIDEHAAVRRTILSGVSRGDAAQGPRRLSAGVVSLRSSSAAV